MAMALLSLLVWSSASRIAASQAVYHGNEFICDTENGFLHCNAGDNIVCDSDVQCTVECNDNCRGLIINAKHAASLSITECIHCDEMIVYCPQQQSATPNIDNHCHIEIANNINGVTIYSQEAFFDFSFVQSPSNDKNYNVYSSTIHCGDLSVSEFKCLLSYDGNTCMNAASRCQEYRLPSSTPTAAPTLNPIADLFIATTTVDEDTFEIESTMPVASSSRGTTTTTTSTADPTAVTDSTLQYVVERDVTSELDDTHFTDNVNLAVKKGLFSDDRNVKYLVLIITASILWCFCFICVTTMYFQRERVKKNKNLALPATQSKEPYTYSKIAKRSNENELYKVKSKSVSEAVASPENEGSHHNPQQMTRDIEPALQLAWSGYIQTQGMEDTTTSRPYILSENKLPHCAHESVNTMDAVHIQLPDERCTEVTDATTQVTQVTETSTLKNDDDDEEEEEEASTTDWTAESSEVYRTVTSPHRRTKCALTIQQELQSCLKPPAPMMPVTANFRHPRNQSRLYTDHLYTVKQSV